MKRTVVARRRVANRSINGKVFQKTGIPLEAIERGRRRKGWRTIGKGFFLKLSFSGTCLIILSLSLSLCPARRGGRFGGKLLSDDDRLLPLLPGLCSPRDIPRRRLDPEGQCALLFR